jgi:hypothetical protein
VSGGFQARHGRQGWRQQAALQGGDQQLEAFAFELGFLTAAQQLALVGAAIAGVGDRGADRF